MMPKERNGKKISACTKCGHLSVHNEKVKLTDTVQLTRRGVEVVEEQRETLPQTEAECPQCKHPTAYYWTMQTRAADEGETKFLKCAKCKHTWRDYG
jgi:transcription factor S